MCDQEKPSSRLGLASDIFTVIQFLAPILAGLIARLCKASLYLSIGIGVVVFLLLLFTLRWFRRPISARLLGFLQNSITSKSDFECRDKVIEYTYHSRESLSYQSNYTVKILSGSRTEIPDKLKWSAGEVSSFSAVVTGQSIVPIPDAKKDDVQAYLGYQDFHIQLPKRYTKHDQPFPTGFRCNSLKDPERKAMTCLIAGIYWKTTRITLRVRFDKSLNVINIRKLKFSDFLDTEPYDSEPGTLKLDKEQKFHYVDFTIPHPILGGKYAIDWEFQETPPQS